jgi:hypothetical protein
MMAEMDIEATLPSDPTEVPATPADGEFRMYAGGTTQGEIKDAPNAISTILLQPFQFDKTKKHVQDQRRHLHRVRRRVRFAAVPRCLSGRRSLHRLHLGSRESRMAQSITRAAALRAALAARELGILSARDLFSALVERLELPGVVIYLQ